MKKNDEAKWTKIKLTYDDVIDELKQPYHAQDKKMNRLVERVLRERESPRPPMPALSSACLYIAKQKNVDVRIRAHFSSLGKVGQLIRTKGIEHAIRAYFDGVHREMRKGDGF